MKENWNKWTKKILKGQGLEKWKVTEKGAGGSGCTIFKTKTICCGENHYALFLHEVAHAILGKNHTFSHNHDAIWGDLFTKLCADYLSPL